MIQQFRNTACVCCACTTSVCFKLRWQSTFAVTNGECFISWHWLSQPSAWHMLQCAHIITCMCRAKSSITLLDKETFLAAQAPSDNLASFEALLSCNALGNEK